MGKHAVIALPDVHKIAVLRANAVGDFIFSLPALAALRAAYPEAEIVLLAKEWHANFLANRPSPIDRVVVIPPYGGVGADPGIEEDPAEIENFFKHMMQEHFDLAIQMHGGGGHSNPFTRRLKAKITVGLKAPEAEPLDYWIPYFYFQSEIARYLEVVALVGASPVTIDPHIIVTQRDREEASRYISPADQPVVVLHPGASDIRRRWPADKFAEVGDALAAAGAHIVVTGSEQERELTATVVRAMHTTAQDLSGCLSLGGLAGLLEYARIVVTNDTGPMHLAHAVGSKTVGIYWAYNVLTAGQLTRGRHRPVMTWRMHCPVCGTDNAWSPCEHHVSFVSDISVQDVIAPALELLFS
jgi:ADP-heptose:LPS heptosyltransferase